MSIQFKSLVTISLGLVLLSSCAKQEPNAAQSYEHQTRHQDSPAVANIVGGEIPNPESIISRHTVGLYAMDVGALCTGTIIGKRLILTAAHCVDKTRKLAVFFGPSIENPEYAIGAEKVVIYGQYETRQNQKIDIGDMALVLLKKDIPPTHLITPIVPSDYVPAADQIFVIAGYGVTNGILKDASGTLRMAAVRLVEGELGDSEFVTDQTLGSGACFGDSGGPAYVIANDELYLAGVVSRVANKNGDPCKGIAVYSNAGHFRPFLQRAVKQLTTPTSSQKKRRK
jgi:V8-like Glu-specific endopeptidase